MQLIDINKKEKQGNSDQWDGRERPATAGQTNQADLRAGDTPITRGLEPNITMEFAAV